MVDGTLPEASPEPQQASSSRRRAQHWPYPRHKDFVAKLRAAAEQWFRDRGCVTDPQRPYCLSRWEDWRQNIILPEVAQDIAGTRGDRKGKHPFPLHKEVHHGLSSQAMGFNLFGPMRVHHDVAPFQQALAAEGVSWPDGATRPRFEYENREVFNEEGSQPTSIDLAIGPPGKRQAPRLFIECKLTEQQFGRCSVFVAGDCDGSNPCERPARCYLHYIGRTYWKLLKKYGFTDLMRSEKQCVLANHYQFFREVLFALEMGGTFILVSDERSPVFRYQHGVEKRERGLVPFLGQFVPETVKARIGCVSVQRIVEQLSQSDRHQWVHEFRKKYAILENE